MDFELLGRRPNRQTLFTNGILRYSDRAPLSTSFSDFLKQFSCFKPTNRGVEGGARLVKRGGARLVKRFQPDPKVADRCEVERCALHQWITRLTSVSYLTIIVWWLTE
ncbi:hypothetical protein FEAC_13320 [Ferrimicrobium acidiphilum DSM 19497]|uniref:Uncharacterized protein n=1 Tax=Ferrimicrobium acidiphilum DSM 19497 TaxID=1121877 RepID=A0A0D8FV71_9ACTN|nr:hypothetical protein FEAC_13320 [Ferrimicrobium acidiphilum DSM 19497]